MFETNNTDLATFLILEGETFIKCVSHPDKPHMIFMQFEDSMGKCRDLERVYLNSQYKRYRDIHRWLLNEMHAIKRSK